MKGFNWRFALIYFIVFFILRVTIAFLFPPLPDFLMLLIFIATIIVSVPATIWVYDRLSEASRR